MTGIRMLTLDGRAQSLSAWARESGLTRQALHSRLARGQALAVAIRAETVTRVEAGRRGAGSSRWRVRLDKC